jgi:hypothetical protein
VAAGSWRPSLLRKAARLARGLRSARYMFCRLRRPSNLLASQRLVTNDGSDIFVEQPNSRISTARNFGVDPCGSCVLCRQDRRRENE